MKEITLNVERDADSGYFVATWDDPSTGGITTQGGDLGELQANVREAIVCHFGADAAPRRVRLHFVEDPVLQTV